MAEEKVKKPKVKGARLKNFTKGIFVENPLFVMVLGTCPALATTTSIESAIGMGLLFSIVLICSNILISLLRKIIPDEIRTPAYIVVIATFVTIVKMLTNAFLPELYQTLGVFISLIVVNCIVLGRAEAFASKNTVLDSLLDGCGMGIGYTLALITIAFFREVLGSGMITFGKVFRFGDADPFRIPLLKYVTEIGGVKEVIYDYSIPMLQRPAGAFIVFGLVMAVIGFINVRKTEKAEFLKRFKNKVEHVDDDKLVNLSRILFMVGALFVFVIGFDFMFASPVSVNGVGINWHIAFFGDDEFRGAAPAFVGFIIMLIGAILAAVAVIFNKNWNKKYISLVIASAVCFAIAPILIFAAGDIFAKVNPTLENVKLSYGAIVGASLSIVASLVTVFGLIGPGLIDSYLVEHPRPVKEVAAPIEEPAPAPVAPTETSKTETKPVAPATPVAKEQPKVEETKKPEEETKKEDK